MSDSIANDPDFNDALAKTRPSFRSCIGRFLAVIGVVLFLFAMSLPAYRSARNGAYQAWCGSQLKQIGLALSSYQEVYGSLPPAHTVDASGRPLHSWRTLILPYLEQEALYKTIDLSKPWNDPANANALATAPSVFHCPVERGRDVHSIFYCPVSIGPENTTTYLAIVGPNACFLPTTPRPLAEIIDRHDFTLMLIEAGEENAVPWMAPVDANESLVLGIGPSTKLHHPGGMNAAFVAGNVSFLKTSLADKIRRALMSISGNDYKSVFDQY